MGFWILLRVPVLSALKVLSSQQGAGRTEGMCPLGRRDWEPGGVRRCAQLVRDWGRTQTPDLSET